MDLLQGPTSFRCLQIARDGERDRHVSEERFGDLPGRLFLTSRSFFDRGGPQRPTKVPERVSSTWHRSFDLH